MVEYHLSSHLFLEILIFLSFTFSKGMRKEYAHARSLAIAQAQVLRAYDEIKMATSRLRLRENENDKSIDAFSLNELDTAIVENSSERLMSLTSLSRIKGQLRYLKVSWQFIHSANQCFPKILLTFHFFWII